MTILSSLKKLTGFASPGPTPALLRELVRHFLTGAIEQREGVLAEPGAPRESYREDITKQYSQWLETTLNEGLLELKKSHPNLFFPKALEGKLSEIYFRCPLTDDDFASPTQFQELLGQAGSTSEDSRWFPELPLPPKEARAIASAMLGSIQKVALKIIRTDYPPTEKFVLVPPEIKAVIDDLLTKLDEIAAEIFPFPALKSLPDARSELYANFARSEHRVALPVRSIPTAPLTDKDVEKHYVGRPDENTQKLARQVRHADGTILVTGYRGVGKSSFVNRAIHHVLKHQQKLPKDGWLIVPVTVNLAKVAGVQNILRLTLRAVRNTLIDPDTGKARPIPGFGDTDPSVGKAPLDLLPLRREMEIEPLQEAYARATYKVTMTRANATESKSAVEGSLGLDVAKWIAPVGGILPSLGIKTSKSRTQSLNRSLSLLDYDENAAEEDLSLLIRNLATERPLKGATGPTVRIKLVFIFDELDKMKLDEGLMPMIEGLKNLFLQQYSVFILVASKNFYYKLLKDRAMEDAMLNSYFSFIVPVPLLTYDQARQMVDDWIDWPEGTSDKPAIEKDLLDQLTRWLLYRSYGNPREIIRELRNKQDWEVVNDRPYLSERLKSRDVLIFAEIQKIIEKAAQPNSEASADPAAIASADPSEPSPDAGPADPDATSETHGKVVTLASERASDDESRLEQIRRGLYILTEALISQEILSLKLIDLKQLRENNFSLLQDSDVERLAKKLGNELSLLHTSLPAEVFADLNGSERPKLFQEEDQALRTMPEFYWRTGRQATGATVQVNPTEPETDVSSLIHQAELLVQASGLAEQRAAIGRIKQIGSSNLTPKLEEFLLDVSTKRDAPLTDRQQAAAQLTQEMLFKIPDLEKLVTQETDEETLSWFLSLLGKATDATAKARATDALLALFKSRRVTGLGAIRGISGKTAETALNNLQAVADRDVLDDVLEWLCTTSQTAQVQEAALSTLNLLSARLNVDQTEKILSNTTFLRYFVLASRPSPYQFSLEPNYLAKIELAAKYYTHLRTLFSSKPPDYHYLHALLRSEINESLTHLLTPLWQAAFDRSNPALGQFVVRVMAEEDSGKVSDRLVTSLRQFPEFQTTMLPYLEEIYKQSADSDYSEPQRNRIDSLWKQLAAPIAVIPPVAPPPAMAQTPFAKDVWRPPSIIRSSFPHLGTVVLLILVTLTIDIFLTRLALPAGTSLSQAFLSCLIIFAADSSVISSVWSAVTAVNRVKEKADLSPTYSYSNNQPWFLYGALIAAWLVVVATQDTYVKPVRFWYRIIFFVVNLPAVSLLSTYLARR